MRVQGKTGRQIIEGKAERQDWKAAAIGQTLEGCGNTARAGRQSWKARLEGNYWKVRLEGKAGRQGWKAKLEAKAAGARLRATRLLLHGETGMHRRKARLVRAAGRQSRGKTKNEKTRAV